MYKWPYLHGLTQAKYMNERGINPRLQDKDTTYAYKNVNGKILLNLFVY